MAFLVRAPNVVVSDAAAPIPTISAVHTYKPQMLGYMFSVSLKLYTVNLVDFTCCLNSLNSLRPEKAQEIKVL